MIIIGWGIGQPLALDFDLLEIGVLFVSVYVVNSLIQDGKSHWLEGFMLLASYLIIAVTFFVAK
jgi:Ca2+:H+ antiporter